jgi:hypothetical protein
MLAVSTVYKKNGTITVRLSNLTRGTITIPQKAIICEVQPVTIETQSTPNSDKDIKLLKLSEVYTHTDGTILLSNDDNCRSKWRVGWSNHCVIQ